VNNIHSKSCLMFTLSLRTFNLQWSNYTMKSLYSIFGVEIIHIVINKSLHIEVGLISPYNHEQSLDKLQMN
jgi:hypothetical protein